MSNNGDKLYQVLSLDLATARTNVEIFPTVPGGWDVIRVVSSTNSGDILTIRFPNVTDDGFDLQPGRGVKLKGGVRLPRFFVTNSAIAGATMILLIGGETGADIDVSDQVSVVSLPNIDIQNVAAGFAQDMTRQLGLVDLQTSAAGFTQDMTRQLGLVNLQTSAAGFTDDLARFLGTTRPWFLHELRAGRAFMGGATVTAVGGQFSHVQLMNPAGSGNQVIVLGINVIQQTATSTFQLRRHNTALTLVIAGANLDIGEAASTSEIRTTTNAALQGFQMGLFKGRLDENFQLFPSHPYIAELDPGEGILVVDTVVNQTLTTTYLFIEGAV